MGDFYGTGIEIWAGFGPIGNTEKRVWADYEQLLRGKKYFRFFLKHCSVRTKNLHKLKLIFFF